MSISVPFLSLMMFFFAANSRGQVPGSGEVATEILSATTTNMSLNFYDLAQKENDLKTCLDVGMEVAQLRRSLNTLQEPRLVSTFSRDSRTLLTAITNAVNALPSICQGESLNREKLVQQQTKIMRGWVTLYRINVPSGFEAYKKSVSSDGNLTKTQLDQIFSFIRNTSEIDEFNSSPIHVE